MSLIPLTSSIHCHLRSQVQLVPHTFDPHFHTSEDLITLLLHTFTLIFFFRILCQTHSPVYTTSPLSQPLVLYRLQIIADLSQPCHQPRSSSSTLPNTLEFTSSTTPSIYTLSNHGYNTQHCLNPTLSENHSITHIHAHHDTRPTICIKILHCFQHFFRNSIHP